MLKRLIVDIPYNPALSRVYFYGEDNIHYRYLTGDSKEYLCPIHTMGKTLENIIDTIKDNDWITFHISRAKHHICSGECKNEFNKEIIELAERIKG